MTKTWRENHPQSSSASIWNLISSLNSDNLKKYRLLEAIDLPLLPREWRWIHIGDISSGPEYGSAQKSAKTGKVPVVRMGNIQNERIVWDDLVFTSDDQEIEKYRLQPGDVLFNRTNSPELVGKSAIYKGEKAAIFAGYLIRINHYKCINPDYLNFYMDSFIAKRYGNKVKTDGVNQSNISGAKLCSYPFPLCAEEEQKEVVKELELHLSLYNQIVQYVDANLQRAASLRQSILKQAFEGNL